MEWEKHPNRQNHKPNYHRHPVVLALCRRCREMITEQDLHTGLCYQCHAEISYKTYKLYREEC